MDGFASTFLRVKCALMLVALITQQSRSLPNEGQNITVRVSEVEFRRRRRETV